MVSLSTVTIRDLSYRVLQVGCENVTGIGTLIRRLTNQIGRLVGGGSLKMVTDHSICVIAHHAASICRRFAVAHSFDAYFQPHAS